jgi:hypothetical protein
MVELGLGEICHRGTCWSPVMAGLVPAIHVLAAKKDVDARLKAGHDG